MTIVALLISGVLFPVAVLHAAWGIGVRWPAKDEAALVKTVIGDPRISAMPGLGLTLMVALGISGAGVWALWGARLFDPPLPGWARTIGLLVLIGVFGLRGVVTYLPFGPLSGRSELFATLDRRYYAPLILLISAGFVLLYLDL